jgi:hypothetical protein
LLFGERREEKALRQLIAFPCNGFLRGAAARTLELWGPYLHVSIRTGRSWVEWTLPMLGEGDSVPIDPGTGIHDSG